MAVFTHVQSMPLAFFARSRTGALVSRLNNDVIGAQSAITSTLSVIVANSIQLVLAVAVMITLAWQVTVLSILLLPMFVLPARRMGNWIAELRREAADLNAAMGNTMTERFSAPGATLVKLFGDPRREAVGVPRAGRQGAGDRRAVGDGVAAVRDGAVAGLRARPGDDLRARRLPGRDRPDPGGHRRRARAAAHPPLHADDPAGERARGHHDRAGGVRARLRGARPAADDHRAAGRARAAGRPGRGAAARRAVHLPARRGRVAGLAGGGRRARPARERRGAARRRPGDRPAAVCSRSSDRPVRASRRSPRWSRGSTTSTRARSSWPAWTSATCGSPRSAATSAW